MALLASGVNLATRWRCLYWFQGWLPGCITCIVTLHYCLGLSYWHHQLVLSCYPVKMQSYIGCICFTFLRCVFSNVSSNRLPQNRQNHIPCICLTFLQCVFSNVSAKRLTEKMQRYIGCICFTFLCGVLSNVSSTGLPVKMQSHIGCICLVFLRCVFLNVS